MVRDPVVYSLIILLRVFDVLVDLRRVEGLSGAMPGTHVNADGKSIREDLLRGLDINIPACGRGGRVEVWMMRGELAAEGYIQHKSGKER